MKSSLTKMIVAGAIFGAVAIAPGVGVSASDLDTEIPGAGISIALSGYMDNTDNPETQIVGLLPEKVEKAAPANNEVFNNMAIAFVTNYVNVRKKPTTESKIVGKIYNNCSATILEEKNGWYKIKSGNVTGYIKSEFFLTGSDAEEYAIEMGYVFAQVKEAGLRVRARSTTEARIVTNVYENEIYSVRNMTDNGKWTKLSIKEGLRGWVSSEYIELSVHMDTAISLEEEKKKLEEESRLAEEEASRQAAEQAWLEYVEESKAAAEQAWLDYLEESKAAEANNNSYQEPAYEPEPEQDPEPVYEPEPEPEPVYEPEPEQQPSYDAPSSGGAADVVAYAKQFLGNPYVYGGSSLTNGTDCSGFTMSVYAHFGYSISRASYTQVYDGTPVSLDAVQPGDLIFYKNGGTNIGHVAMYIGGGQIIHASTESTGIIISSMYHSQPCAARRIIN